MSSVIDLRDNIVDKVVELGVCLEFLENPAFVTALSEVNGFIEEMQIEDPSVVLVDKSNNYYSFSYINHSGDKYKLGISCPDERTVKCVKEFENHSYVGEDGNVVRQKNVVEQIATLDEEKNYDIRDILDKAKVNKKIDNSYHSINNTNYNILKNIKTFDSYEEEEESERLKDLINTITNTSLLNQMGDKDLSLDLLDDLKSDDDDTIIESKDSVKALLEQAKMEAKKEVKNNVPVELDKSFFTSSLNFGEDDFEQISNLNKKLKKNTVLIRILILLIIIAVTIGIIFLVYSLIK